MMKQRSWAEAEIAGKDRSTEVACIEVDKGNMGKGQIACIVGVDRYCFGVDQGMKWQSTTMRFGWAFGSEFAKIEWMLQSKS